MSKKRGLSLEEKKTKMLEIFYQNKDFYQLKELEKIAPKEKGIIAQSVKEVIQILVDDHFVNTEKIGTSVYFWAFPSNAKHVLKRKLTQVEKDVFECESNCEKIHSSIEKEKEGRIDSIERTHMLQTLEVLQEKETFLKNELLKYRNSDPEYMTQLKDEVGDIKEAINRWTENIETLKSYCKDKFGLNEEDLCDKLNIPKELDYVN